MPTDLPVLELLREMAHIFWHDALAPHWSTALGATLAMYVFSRQLSERRPPGNIMAWGMLVLTFPVIGLVLFMLFGARKRAEMGRLRAVVGRVARRVQGADDDKVARRTDAVSAGNRFGLLADDAGTATYLELRERIAGATTSIHILTYIFGDDTTGRELVKQLAGRARAGVKVRLLVDALGSRQAGDAMFRELTDAGGEVARFMPFAPWKSRSSANLRNHRKLAVFDGEHAVVGGQNLALEYTGATPSPARFRDFGALISGPAAADFNRLFIADWCFATGCDPETLRYDLAIHPPAEGGVGIEVVGGGPDYVNDPIWEKLVVLAANCRSEIIVVTPYIVPDEVLLRLLAAKARSGRKVVIITPKKSDHPFLDFARRHHLKVLRDAGAVIYFHEKGMLHGKLFLVDREVGMIGSANLDMRSLFVNFELATVVRDPEAVESLLKLALTLAKESKPAGKPRNKAVSFKERTLENLAHLLAPWL